MKCNSILLFFTLALCVAISWQDTGSRVRRLKLQNGRCPSLRLANGVVRSRARGKIVRFNCLEGYMLVGNKYSTCIHGQWDTPLPVCVNSKCTEPPTPEHALAASKYNGAMLMYFCEPGYILVGSAEIYCDGRHWNGTTPTCRDTSASAPTKCDFEKPDLCWWEQDPLHDFDWRRHNFETPSTHLGTGPTHDHTLGPGNDGYYLYIEASGRFMYDKARIISPIYNHSLTEDGCFSFWYHMYGATIGFLNIYFKPENGATQMLFQAEGNQGNEWRRGVFTLPHSEQNFQILIEGVRGSSYVSDIAVDDVAILQGDECNIKNVTSVTATDEDQVEIFNAMQSCRNRCGNNFETTVSSIISSSDVCQCNFDCAVNSTCCPDFPEFCVLGVTATDEVTETIGSPPTKVMSTRTTSETVAVVTQNFRVSARKDNANVIPTNPKDDIDPNTVLATTEAGEIETETTAASVMRTTVAKSMRKNLQLATTTTPTTMTTTTRTRTRTRTRTTTTARTRMMTTRMQRLTSSRRVTTAAPSAGIFTNYTESGTHAKIQENRILMEETGSGLDVSYIIEMIIGSLTLGICLVAVVFFIRRRKLYKRSNESSALSEDSDVRFLTSDEVLDFNIARPSSNDYEEM